MNTLERMLIMKMSVNNDLVGGRLDTLENLCEQAKRIAKLNDCVVAFSYDSIKFSIVEESSTSVIAQEYVDQLKANHKATLEYRRKE